MNILCTSEVSAQLLSLIKNSNDIRLISAFLTESIFNLFRESDFNKSISLYIRARPTDCLNGSCDLDSVKKLIECGVKCYINNRLHAKIYIFDSAEAVIGSSNLTANGLGFSNFPNFELNYFCTLSKSEIAQIDEYLNDSLLVSIEDIENMQNELDNLTSINVEDISPRWKCLEKSKIKSVMGLFIEDLPKCNPFNYSYNSSEEILHDEILFGIENKNWNKFKESNAYQFIYQFIKQEPNNIASFGQLSKYLHHGILDEFSPYRKDIKAYLQKIIKYIEYYDCYEIAIDKPNHSQLLKLK